MEKITRKGFLKLIKNFFTAIGLGTIAVPIIAYFYPAELEEVPTDPIPVGSTDEIPVGKSKTVQFGRYPAIVINTPDGIKAYSAVCTHFACITKWNEDLGQIVCPCHDGYFDPLDGSVISGPPPTPLEKLNVEIKDDNIYISAGGEA
jgi:Rieske Fe-S protein